MEDNGRKVKNAPQKWHIGVEWCMYCISYRLVSDPNGSINRIRTQKPLVNNLPGLRSLRPKIAVAPKQKQNTHFSHIFCSSKTGLRTPRRQTTQRAGPVGRGRGRVNPPPCGFVLEVLGFGGFVAWLVHIHAWRPEARRISNCGLFHPL